MVYKTRSIGKKEMNQFSGVIKKKAYSAGDVRGLQSIYIPIHWDHELADLQ